jgi:hypothetical protein
MSQSRNVAGFREAAVTHRIYQGQTSNLKRGRGRGEGRGERRRGEEKREPRTRIMISPCFESIESSLGFRV